MSDAERLREALQRLGPGTVEDMAWSPHKWVWRDDLGYYSVVEDAEGHPVSDEAPMASLAAALLVTIRTGKTSECG